MYPVSSMVFVIKLSTRTFYCSGHSIATVILLPEFSSLRFCFHDTAAIWNVLRARVWSLKQKSLCIFQAWRVLIQGIKDLQTMGKAGDLNQRNHIWKSWPEMVEWVELTPKLVCILSPNSPWERLPHYGPWEKSGLLPVFVQCVNQEWIYTFKWLTETKAA